METTQAWCSLVVNWIWLSGPSVHQQPAMALLGRPLTLCPWGHKPHFSSGLCCKYVHLQLQLCCLHTYTQPISLGSDPQADLPASPRHHGPAKWLPGCVWRWWTTLDLILTDFCSHLDFGPALSPQSCLMTQAPSWSPVSSEAWSVYLGASGSRPYLAAETSASSPFLPLPSLTFILCLRRGNLNSPTKPHLSNSGDDIVWTRNTGPQAVTSWAEPVCPFHFSSTVPWHSVLMWGKSQSRKVKMLMGIVHTLSFSNAPQYRGYNILNPS